MGQCLLGQRFVSDESISGQDKESLDIIMSLKFTGTEIDKLYRAFKRCDIDGSNNIRAAELFASYSIEMSTFNSKVFALFDEDLSGEINFLEFVVANWNFLTLSREDMGVMAFMMVDPQGKRTMDLVELKDLIETMHGKSIETVPVLANSFNELMKNFSGRFKFNEFVQWAAKNPPVCAPLESLKISIMNKLLGQDFWLRKHAERYADKEMKEPHYVFKFQKVISEIHERGVREADLRKLHQQIAEVRGYVGKSGGKDRKQDEIMEKFGLGEKKAVRKGVNMVGDIDVAIREGADDIFKEGVSSATVSKKEKDAAAVAAEKTKSGRASIAKKSEKRQTVVSASGKVVPDAHPPSATEDKPADNHVNVAPTASRKSGRATIVQGQPNREKPAEHIDDSTGPVTEGQASTKSRKTVLAPIDQAPSSSPSAEGGPRRGRQTFVQKKT